MRSTYLEKSKRIVVKVGTKSLIDDRNRLLDREKIKKIVTEIAELFKASKEIILVSSGAIISGAGILGLKQRPKSIPEKQAVASVGQITLMDTYKEFFEKFDIKIGQVLLTEDDLKDRQRYLNARNTIITLIENFKVIPIINENDVVGIEEIIFGDNDVLAALVANFINADLLVLLTTTDGFCLLKDGKTTILSEVKKITPEIEECAGETEDMFGTGGMKSKLQAVKIATRSGIPSVIANSAEKNVLTRILEGESIGTFFYPTEKGLSQKKRWIAYSVAPKGRLIIDDGAKKALVERGKSLLPSGILKVEGEFKPGDPVDIVDLNNNVVARGLVNYDNTIIEKIKGRRSEFIKSIVGEKYYPEAVHRDNLVVYEI